MISGNLLNVIRESSFERNSAGGAGGAIHSSLQNSGLMITRSFLWENNAPTMGGAVYVGDDHDNMTLSNVEIRHCHAQDGGGVYIGQRNTRITVVNASIFQNEVNKILLNLIRVFVLKLRYCFSKLLLFLIYCDEGFWTWGGDFELCCEHPHDQQHIPRQPCW